MFHFSSFLFALFQPWPRSWGRWTVAVTSSTPPASSPGSGSSGTAPCAGSTRSQPRISPRWGLHLAVPRIEPTTVETRTQPSPTSRQILCIPSAIKTMRKRSCESNRLILVTVSTNAVFHPLIPIPSTKQIENYRKQCLKLVFYLFFFESFTNLPAAKTSFYFRSLINVLITAFFSKEL